VSRWVSFDDEGLRARPSIRRIMGEFNLKSPSRLYNMFPGRQKQICREASVPYPAERVKLIEGALKARKCSAERLERGDLDFAFERRSWR